MASPSQTQAPPAAQPPSPTEPSSSNPAAATSSQSQPAAAPTNNASPSGTPAAAAASATTTAAPGPATGPATATATPQPAQIPSTSLTDSGKTRRPRDIRLIHMLLASLGVTAYQERVPLQLLDFAYRYTSSVLQDAVHLSTEGYAGATNEPGSGTGRGGGGSGGGGGGGSGHDVNTVSLSALRLSIASRLHYQFQTGLPREFLVDVASERNRVALPGASRGFSENANNKASAHESLVMGGMRLPPERFCLTGIGWDMKEEWESEGEEEIEQATGEADGSDDGQEGDQGDDEDGKMEDVFGEDTAMGEGSGGQGEDEDKDMTDV